MRRSLNINVDILPRMTNCLVLTISLFSGCDQPVDSKMELNLSSGWDSDIDHLTEDELSSRWRDQTKAYVTALKSGRD